MLCKVVNYIYAIMKKQICIVFRATIFKMLFWWRKSWDTEHNWNINRMVCVIINGPIERSATHLTVTNLVYGLRQTNINPCIPVTTNVLRTGYSSRWAESWILVMQKKWGVAGQVSTLWRCPQKESAGWCLSKARWNRWQVKREWCLTQNAKNSTIVLKI